MALLRPHSYTFTDTRRQNLHGLLPAVPYTDHEQPTYAGNFVNLVLEWWSRDETQIDFVFSGVVRLLQVLRGRIQGLAK